MLLALWLDTLLAESSLGLTWVVAGDKSRASGPIQWIHISDLPDPTPWLAGGELLLTTGLGLRGDEALQQDFVQRVAEYGCVGVGYSLGDDGLVPSALVSAAENFGLPLFTIPHQVPLIAITKAVSLAILEEQHGVLNEAVKMHRGILRVILEDGGLDGLLQVAANFTPGYDYQLYDCFGNLLANSSDSQRPDTHVLFAELTELMGDSERCRSRMRDVHIEASAVLLAGDVQAHLVAAGGRPMRETELLYFEQALTGVTLEMARRLSFREQRRLQVKELLEDFSSQSVPAATTSRRMQRLGINPDGKVQVLCVRSAGDLSEPLISSFLEDIVGTVPGIVGLHEGRFYCLLQDPREAVAREIISGARARRWLLQVGRSTTRVGCTDMLVMLREARLAAGTADDEYMSVRDVSDFGLAGIVANLYESPGASTFIERTLGPLMKHDKRENAFLVDTLRKYLQNGSRPGPAARELYIHRHTLTYRLGRIQEITGRDPRNGQDLLAFGLALELLEQREDKS
jgi:purine catabolism regulator